MDEETVIYIRVCVCVCVCVCVRNGIFFSLKKEGDRAICDNMDGPGRQNVK